MNKKKAIGQKAAALARKNNTSQAQAAQDTINQIGEAAERTRVAILQSVGAEIQALQEQLQEATDVKAPEIPAAILTAIAAIKANATKTAWLGYFGVYHQYGIVPRAVVPADAPPPEEVAATDAEEFAKKEAAKVIDEVEEKKAKDDLAVARAKLVEDQRKKH